MDCYDRGDRVFVVNIDKNFSAQIDGVEHFIDPYGIYSTLFCLVARFWRYEFSTIYFEN